MASLGHNIAMLRNKRGLSQAQLAEKLGIGTSTLGMYETDKREPSYETLVAIADFFNKSVDELLGRNSKLNSSNDIPTDADLDKALDNAHSFDGKPMDDHDRQIIKGLLKGYFENKN